ncbi:GerMN domain-containing protein [Salibacterium sp. K-3]
MKRDDRASEERIKQSLEQLPQVKDKRPKEDIYHHIVKHPQRAKQKPVKKWAMPAFSAAAALILLLVLIPNMITMNNQSGSSGESSSQPEEEADMNVMEGSKDQEEASREASRDESGSGGNADSDASTQSREQTEETEVEKEPEVNTEETALTYNNYVPALPEEERGASETVATIAVQDPDASIVVPVTFTASSENKAALMDEKESGWNAAEFGLGNAPLHEVNWVDGGENSFLEADFSDAETPVSSAQSDMMVKSMQEMLRYTEESQVLLTNDGEAGVDLGGYGMTENYREQEDNRGYYMYTSETNDQFLVSQQAADLENSGEDGKLFTLAETLEQMKSVPENSAAAPSIPEEVSIESAGGENGMAEIVFSEETGLEGDGSLRWMMEAILFTAADFGYEQVRFEGISPDTSGGYPVEEPVDIPAAPNLIE